MFVLKKCITAFLLPPGAFIPLLLAMAWWSRRQRRNGSALVLLLTAVALWGSSLNPVSNSLMAGLEQGLTLPEHPQGDVIILLGGGTYDRVPDLSGRGAPSETALTRLVTAARLQKRLELPVIVSGGGVYEGRTAEAVISRRFLIDLGVPADKILTEINSRDTTENARFTRHIMELRGFRRPLLITSAFHMRRALAAFRAAGIEVMPVPAGFTADCGGPAAWNDWLPDANAMRSVSGALKEHIGMLYYRLAGMGSR